MASASKEGGEEHGFTNDKEGKPIAKEGLNGNGMATLPLPFPNDITPPNKGYKAEEEAGSQGYKATSKASKPSDRGKRAVEDEKTSDSRPRRRANQMIWMIARGRR